MEPVAFIDREVCKAIDVKTGQELWSRELDIAKYGHDGGNSGARGNRGGDGPRSTPATDGARVYVMTANLKLFCLDARHGDTIWSKDLLRQHHGRNITWKNAASPLLEGEQLYIAGGGPGEALMAVNKNSGEVVWSGESDRMTHATPVPATIHDVRQIIFFTQEGLVSTRANDGKVLWRHPFPFNVSTAASPVVAGNFVYCSAGYGVGAGLVRIEKSGERFVAKEVWRKRNDLMNHWSTPVHKDGYLYGMFGFKEYGSGPLQCVELKTGRVVWEKNGFGAGNVIRAGETLIALGDAGQLVLVEATPNRYRELARNEVLEGKCWSTPALANGKLFLRSTREGVCLDVSTKTVRAR